MLKTPRRRGLENVVRQDQPISHDHGGIGVERAEALLFPGAFSDSGVSTGIPACSAASCTGDFRNFMPRPASRGGWV